MSVDQVLSRFTAVVDELLDADLSSATPDDLLTFLRGFETQKRRLAVVDHRAIVAVDQLGTAATHACRDTKTLLREALRLTPREAKARYTAAVDLGPRRTLTGQPLAPLFPRTAAAQEAGVISAEHASVIRRCVAKLPPAIEAEHGAAVEERLVTEAEKFDPRELAKLAQRISAHLNPDGVLASDAEHRRRRSAVLFPNPDGSGELHAHLTPGCLAKLQAVFDPLAAPRPADESGPDDRTPAQRLHDALEDAATRLLTSGGLPDVGGSAVTVLLTMTAEQFADGEGYATTGHGGLISIPEALKLADNATIVPVVLDASGGIVAYGRDRRYASPGQRAALAARDKGCSFPACDHPPAWTEAHHVIEWRHGGTTDLDNLTLVCPYHHREFGPRGWRVQMNHGVPEWIPPKHVDPDQKPRRNTQHVPTPPFH